MVLFVARLLSSFTFWEEMGAAAEAWTLWEAVHLYSCLYAPVRLWEGLPESSTGHAVVSQFSIIV